MSSNKRLNATLTIGGAVSSSLGNAIRLTKRELDGLGSSVRKVYDEQQRLKASMKGLKDGDPYLTALKRRYGELGDQIDRARKKNEALVKLQKRGAMVAGVGAGMTVAGGVMAAPVFNGVREASSYQTEASRLQSLGMGDSTTRDAIAFARSMKTYGTSALENLTLVRDALSVFSDLDHAKMAAPILAKMKFANAAAFGAEHGAENEAAFMDMLKVIELRGGTKSEAAFGKQANMVQRVISATGGRVGPEEWRHVIATGGLAAAGMRDDAFFYQLEPLIQMIGGDRTGTGLTAAYNSLYQGHITKRAANNLQKLGLISDPSKVKHDKSGQISFIDRGALKGSDLFRQSQIEWVKQVLVPTLKAHGIVTEDQIIDAIGSITNKNGGAFLAKIYQNQALIDKDAARNEKSYDIDQLDEQGRKTPAGEQIAAEKKLADLKLKLGTQILPMYTRALELTSSALDKLNAFTERHPTLAKVMAVSLTAVAGALVTVGAVLVPVGGAIASAAGLSMMMAKAGMTWGGVFRMLVAPIRWVATAVMFLGRALLMNPIGLAITGIAVGAFLIYKYWKPIKAFFVDLWDGIKAKTLEVSDWIVQKMQWIGGAWQKVKEFFGFGDSAGSVPTPGAAGASAPPPLPPVAHGRGGQTVTQQTNHITIHQQPGQSAAQLADEVAKKLAEKDAQRNRSALYDPMNAAVAW